MFVYYFKLVNFLLVDCSLPLRAWSQYG